MGYRAFSFLFAFALLTGCVENRQVPDEEDGGITQDGDFGDSGEDDGGGDPTDAGQDGADPDIDANPLQNVGTCSAPLMLETLGTVDEEGVTWFLGSTVDGSTELDGTCQEKTGNENVFLYTAPGRGSLEISTGSERTDFDTVLYVRTDCAVETAELACDDDGGPELQSQVAFEVMGGEHLFIIVDSIEEEVGTFELSVAFEPAPASGETCDEAIPLTFSGDENTLAQSSGDTSDARNDDDGSCLSSDGPELYYTFTLDEPSGVLVRTESDDEYFDIVLHLRDSCAAEEALHCADNFYDEEEQLVIPQLEAGTYVVGVDGYFDSDSGPFDIEISLFAPLTSCDHPHDLVTSGTTDEHGVFHYIGDNNLGTDELEGSCGLGFGREVVLEYTPAEDGLLLLSTDNDTTEFDTVIYVLRDCDHEESELACDDQGGEGDTSFVLVEVSAGEVFHVVVDGSFSDERGAFELTTELIADLAEPSAGGENESSAAPLSFVGNGTFVASGEGSTIGAYDDIEGSCLYDNEGMDHVYSFTLEEARDVHVILETEEDFDAGLYVRTSSGDELDCVDEAYDSQEDLFLFHLPAGTYFVVVDGYDDDEVGHYDLMVIATPLE